MVEQSQQNMCMVLPNASGIFSIKFTGPAVISVIFFLKLQKKPLKIFPDPLNVVLNIWLLLSNQCWFPGIWIFVVQVISLAPCKKPIEFLKSLDLCGRLLKIMVGKVSLRCNCRGKTLLGIVNKLCLITSSKLNCLTELCNQGDATFYMHRLKVGQTVSMFNMLHKKCTKLSRQMGRH